MSRVRPYSAKEVAERLGFCTAQFNRLKQHLHEVDGMPAPITSTRHPRWERSGMDCWLMRHHPYAPKQPPANDLLPRPLEPLSIEAEQAELAREYARK